MNARLNAPSQRRADPLPLPRMIEMECFGERERAELRMSTNEKLEVAVGALVVLVILTICALGLAV